MQNLTTSNDKPARKPFWRHRIMICGFPDDNGRVTQPVAEVEAWWAGATADELGPDLIDNHEWAAYEFFRFILRRWPTAIWTRASANYKAFSGQESGEFCTAYPWPEIVERLKGSRWTERQAIRHFRKLEEYALVWVVQQGSEIKWIEPRNR
jgi:hypothetical protein